MKATRTIILDVAERMFAEHGFNGTSVRQIIAAAGVNLAAVHYHFRSKEGLLEAVIERRLEPINRERLALLDQYEQQAGRRGPSVEDILHALMDPLAVVLVPSEEGRLVQKLVGLLHTENGTSFARLARGRFHVLFERFVKALHRAAPELPMQELFWRIHFAMGAMAHALRCSDQLELLSNGRCKVPDAGVAIPHLITFLAAGLTASPPQPARPRKQKRSS